MSPITIDRVDLKLSDYELQRAIDMMVTRNNLGERRNPVPHGAFELGSVTFEYESTMSFKDYREDPSHRTWGEPKLIVKCERTGHNVWEFFNVEHTCQLTDVPAVLAYCNQALYYTYHEWLKKEADAVWRRYIRVLKR